MNTARSGVALACVLATVLAPLAAQNTTTAVASAPHVLIETVGPDGWRLRYGPTNLGSLLESQAGRAIWLPRVLPFLEQWEHAAGDAAAFDAAKERMFGYGGRVRFGMWFTPGEALNGDATRLVLVLEGDGRTDMAALAADVQRLQKQAPGEWKATEIAGQKVDVRRNDKFEMTAPVVVGKCIVMAGANDSPLADALAAATAMAKDAAGKAPPPNTPALRVDVDVPALVALAKTAAPRAADETIQLLGYECLGRLQLTLGTAGPHVMAEVAQQFATAPKGLFAAFCVPAQGVPALQRAVPKQGTWRAGHFDFRALCETVFAVLDTSWGTKKTDTRAEAKKELGIDLIDDLFAHMTDELLVLGSPLQELERPEDFTWLIAARLRDEQKFAKGLATVLEKARPMVQRGEPQTIEGLVCQRYGTAINYKLWIATGHDTVFVAAGRDAEERLAQAIAAVKKGAEASAPAAAENVAKTFADLGKHMPPGLNAQASADLDGVFAIPTELWWMLLSEIMPMPVPRGDKADDEQREKARALLREHNLGTLRSATGYSDSTWRWRVFW